MHYDLEWNPARLEQREGRVDRRGNPIHDRTAARGDPGSGLRVHYLVLRHTYDERVLARVLARRRNMKLVLGAAKATLLDTPPESDVDGPSEEMTTRLDEFMLDLAAPEIPTGLGAAKA